MSGDIPRATGTPNGGEHTLVPREFVETLLDERQPFEAVDWSVPAHELSSEQRLLRLARVKALLPLDNAIKEKSTHDATLENYIRLALLAAGDRDTLGVFLDRVQTVLETQPDECARLAQQVLWIWGNAAEVAGLYQQKTVLEELAFQSLLPDEYERIKAEYDKSLVQGPNGLVARLEADASDLVQSALGHGSFTIASRPKSYYSVWRKLQEEGREVATIYDLIGLRVVIDVADEAAATEQCYVAMAAIANRFDPDSARYKDYITNPKGNGYQSLHLTMYTATGFPFELQIRTRAMHEHAENDMMASHQGYDAAHKPVPGKIKRTYDKVPKLYRWRDEATAAIVKKEGVMENLIPEHILFFRTDGNLYLLPEDANALDASFRIHSFEALKTGVIRDHSGKPLSFGSSVRHGQAIEIIYEDELRDVKGLNELRLEATTRTAEKAIRRQLNELNAEALVGKAKEIIMNTVVQQIGEIGVTDPLDVLTDDDIARLLRDTGHPSMRTRLMVIGAGEGTKDKTGKPGRVAAAIIERLMHPYLGSELSEEDEQEPQYPLHSDEAALGALVVPGADDQIAVVIAGCCSGRIPVGTSVVARPSKRRRVLSVHRAQGCPNVHETTTTIPCSWDY